jgi:lysophospholipase L1-like esterase
MTKITLRSFVSGAALALVVSAPAAAQFDKYVALGDSLTAGVEGNCVVERNQRASFPAVIAQQLGIDDFQQPLVQELPLSSPLTGSPCLGAVFVPPSTVTVGAISQMGAPLNTALTRPYDNLGIAGARVRDLIDLVHGDPNGDTVHRNAALVLRNVPGSPFDGTNAVTQANILQPDLVTLWIGNNDVLGAALAGVVVDGVTLTPVAAFTEKYDEVMAAMTAGGRTIVGANIPDVTAIPFATTIPGILINPATRQPVIIDGHTVPLLGEGNDAYPCTPIAPDHGCPLPDGTLVTLPASALLAQGTGVPVAAGGTGQPLPDGRFVPPAMLVSGVTLYPDEVAAIVTRTNELNAVIAAEIGTPLVDIHAIFEDIKAHNYHIGGLTLTRSFLTGGIFSADGFHPSSIGYTMIADEFIKEMNDSLGTDIPRPDFSHVLFTPNVPAGGAALTDGGIWGYGMSTWEDLLATVAPAWGLAIRYPDTAARATPRDGGRGTRTVVRGEGD